MKTEHLLLKVLDLVQALYRMAGVDYGQLRAIVAIKLTMDNRRQTIATRRKKDDEPGNTFIIALLVYSVLGGFMTIFIYSIPSIMVGMIFFFSYIMVMIAMTLITDFSAILLDTSDNTIILPRPVDGRTLFIARLTHIMLYLGQLALCLSFIPAIAVAFKFGTLVLLFFLVAIILSIITALLITNITYLLIMQFASEEKLKSIINYFQIIMTVTFMGGYQILPRLMGRFELRDYVFEPSWWSFFLPPIWMGATMELIHLHLFDTTHFVFAALCLLVPIAGFYITNKYLTPVFNRKLSMIGNSDESLSIKNKKKNQKSNFMESIGARLTTNAIERAAFELVYKILGRDRKIKLKIYPAVGYILVFGLIFMIRGREDFSATWHNLHNTQYYLVLMYITFMLSQVAIHEIPYSDDFKASWFYSSAPIQHPGEILAGMVKAIFVKLLIPVYAAIAAFILFVWGVAALDDIVFGLFNNIIMILIFATVGKRMLPLSMESRLKGQSGNFMRGIIMMFMIAVPCGLHYLLSHWPLILISLIPIQWVTIYLILKSYKATPWSSIEE